MRRIGRAVVCAAALIIAPRQASAQERVTLQADVLFYGDNTEFRNPFREGETLFGAAVRACAAVAASDRVDVSFGVVLNQRFGGDDAFDLVRPLIRLTVKSRESAFVFGTLAIALPDPALGPDATGPHGLLPPIQRETLAFERPYEAGLQWRFAGASLAHDMWINWQRLNTAEHRERFDAGAAARVGLGGGWALPLQLHLVHEGGQQFASGVVRDSVAAAAGVEIGGAAGGIDRVAIEALGLASRYVPDREQPERSRTGAGFFGRASLQHAGWRGHILFWRGRDFITDEGDPNYLSIRRDGTYYRGTRDYAEAGVTRAFRPAEGVALAASARLHRTEKHYEYSYRVLGTVALNWRLR